MRIRAIACVGFVGLAACLQSIQNVPGVSRPEVTEGGTWTCQQIVEQCDTACESPSCLDDCTAHGTPAAQEQHNTVVSCGQRNFCTDEDCMRANCTSEMHACAPEAIAPPPPASPAPPVDQPAPPPG